MNTQRIAKFIATTGYCSRRDAEKLILEKKVKLNGEFVLHPATLVKNDDIVSVENKKIALQRNPRMWVYHKPPGLITSHKDTKGRETVFENLPKNLPRVISVGRLDYNTEGLLLLTNNGGLARTLELPSTKLVRKYKCRIFGALTDAQIKQLALGITVDGIQYKGITVENQNSTKSNTWVYLALSEGKNREIRNVFSYFGIEVSRLIRVAYGPFVLGDLAPGSVKELIYRDFQKFL